MDQATAVAPAATAAPARDVKLNPGNMLEAEYNRQSWVVNAEPGHTLEDVMKPGYWFHLARDIRPYAHIEVRGPENKWVAWLFVVNSGLNWATCALMNKLDLGGVQGVPEAAETFDVKYISEQGKYGVVRKADGKTLMSGFPAKADAYAWAATNDRLMNI